MESVEVQVSVLSCDIGNRPVYKALTLLAVPAGAGLGVGLAEIAIYQVEMGRWQASDSW